MSRSVTRNQTSGPQSVERALSLLVAISEAKGPVAVTEVARQVDLHPATAHRLLRALVAAGFVVQDASSSRYRLGPTLLQIANAHRQREQLPQRALPILERLTSSTGETTGLLERDGFSTVVIVRVVSSQPLLVHTPVGTHSPLPATPGGRILLAHAADADRDAVLAMPLFAYTEHSITDSSTLHDALEEIRRLGCAVGIDDFHEGVTAVAAPVFDAENRVIAALSIPGPTSRMAGSRLPELVRHVRAAAEELSLELGASVGETLTHQPSS